jgi:hypothetical protein
LSGNRLLGFAVPKVSTLTLVRTALSRCHAYTKRLDALRGRKARVGRNQNIMAASWLDRAIECFEEVEHEEAVEAKRCGVAEGFEHTGEH